MKTLIITIFFQNFVLYFSSSSRFEIIKLGKIVDPNMNFQKLY